MRKKEVNISASGLGNHYDDCLWFIAEFVSPRVGQLRSVDITVKEFLIENRDPGR
jgi:hypothetical protein